MQHVEDTLKDTRYRIEVIERTLKRKMMINENRKELENRLEEIKEVLKENEEKLRILRKENSKSFVVVGCLVFICFLLYGLYLMIFENI